MNTMHTILIIVTSFSEMSPQEPTGIWLEEFAIPYMEFKQNGFNVEVASITGGKAPIDPRSAPSSEQLDTWQEAVSALDTTIPITSLNAQDYDAVFMPGGHGTMFDFPKSKELHNLLGKFAAQDKVIAAVCHGPASLLGVSLSDGRPLVSGKRVTSFTNAEENAAGLTKKMPFLLESRLRELGATFIEQPNWSDHVEIDGNLITGQNPQSSKSIAKAIIAQLNKS